MKNKQPLDQSVKKFSNENFNTANRQLKKVNEREETDKKPT